VVQNGCHARLASTGNISLLVIYEGEIVGEHTGDVSEQEIGLEMLGGQENEAA